MKQSTHARTAALAILPILNAAAQPDTQSHGSQRPRQTIEVTPTLDATDSSVLTHKSGFHLFNPTPRERWRPLAADRPDATESPISVDAGAYQIEASFAELGLDREDGNETTSLSIAPINFKIGLTNRIDLQLLINPLEHTNTSNARAETGTDDVGFRVKINLWGNDMHETGEKNALALLPYVVFPTGDDDVTDDAYQFGLIVPFSTELAGGWSLGAQVKTTFTHDDSAPTQTTAALAHTLVVGHDIAGDLAGYIEYIGEYSFHGDAEYRPTASAGLSYTLNADTVLDAGLLVGLDNGDTKDLRLFTGITRRF